MPPRSEPRHCICELKAPGPDMRCENCGLAVTRIPDPVPGMTRASTPERLDRSRVIGDPRQAWARGTHRRPHPDEENK